MLLAKALLRAAPRSCQLILEIEGVGAEMEGFMRLKFKVE